MMCEIEKRNPCHLLWKLLLFGNQSLAGFCRNGHIADSAPLLATCNHRSLASLHYAAIVSVAMKNPPKKKNRE